MVDQIVIKQVIMVAKKVTKSSTSASSSKEEKSDTFYKIGDTVKVGDAEYTLNSVELTDERNQFEENQPAQVVKLLIP